jgi:hypothetical protein
MAARNQKSLSRLEVLNDRNESSSFFVDMEKLQACSKFFDQIFVSLSPPYRVTRIKHMQGLSLFFSFTSNSSVEFSTATDALNVLLIAEEWDCPSLVLKLLSLLADHGIAHDIITFAREHQSSKIVIDLLAYRFGDFAQSSPRELFELVDSKIRCQVPGSPYFQRGFLDFLIQGGTIADVAPLLGSKFDSENAGKLEARVKELQRKEQEIGSLRERRLIEAVRAEAERVRAQSAARAGGTGIRQ